MSTNSEPVYENEPTIARPAFKGTGTTARAYELESWNYVQHKDYQVHILQEKDKSSEGRLVIPTTTAQRLAFIRIYVTAFFKSQIVDMHQEYFDTFFWMNIWNTLFRSLTTNYIHIFLSSFSPREHLFGAKMIPMFYGVIWQVLICSLLQLVYGADILSIHLWYAIGWIFDKPVSQCLAPYYYEQLPEPKDYLCVSVEEFYNISHRYTIKPKTGDIFMKDNFYFWNNKSIQIGTAKKFIPAPFHRFMRSWKRTSILEFEKFRWISFYSFLWISAGGFYRQIYKKWPWKACYRLQLFEIWLYIIVFLYISWYYLDENTKQIEVPRGLPTSTFKSIADSDLEFLSEVMVAPPILHVLYSRSSQHVNPGRDSALVTLSNFLMYLLQTVIYYRLANFVELLYKTRIQLVAWNPYPIFYIWPFLFDLLPFAEIIMRVFYAVMFVLQLIWFVFTYQIMVDILVHQWKLTNRVVATVLISAAGFVISVVPKASTKIMLHVITTSLTSLTEVILICWVYPLDRFCDDVHFMNGVAMHSWRKWSLRFLPWYHIYKTYWLFVSCLGQVKFVREAPTGKLLKSRYTYQLRDPECTTWVWIVAVLPLRLGLLYAIVKHIYIQKQEWRALLRPRPEWGPTKHVTRQLRKQFDYREYIASRAPRYLSRYMLARAKTASYRLDVRCDQVDGTNLPPKTSGTASV